MTLAERLLEERIVMVVGPLDEERATEAAAQLMTLDASGDEHITLRLSCGESDLDAALTLIDTIDLLGVPVHGVCSGRLAGPAVGVFAVCERRTMQPHATIELREPRTSVEGHYEPATALAAAAEQFARRVDQLCERLAAATGRDAASIRADMRAGLFLDAAAAVAYGLADPITTA